MYSPASAVAAGSSHSLAPSMLIRELHREPEPDRTDNASIQNLWAHI